MKVQTRLSLFSSIVFGVIFAVIALLIYTLYYHNARRTVYETLKQTSLIAAIFYLEEDELGKEDFSKAQKQFEDFVNNSHYQIYNEQDLVSYGTSTLQVSSERLNEIRAKKAVAFSEKEFFGYGIFYEDNQGDFVVITRERRGVLDRQLAILLWILAGSFLFGIIAIILLSRWMAYRAYRPFRTVIRQVKAISTQNLDKQIRIPDTKDELQDLIVTFNDLLSKLSETFVMQKNFVSYVSHEFKTPLASMMGNLEVFSLKDRSPEEYRRLCNTLLQQIHELEATLDTLLIISDLRNKSDVSASLRIDELIWEIIARLNEQYRQTLITVNIEVAPEDEQLLTVAYDKTQLLIALFNLIENAVKYAQEKPVEILLGNKNDLLYLSITDQGIGIPADQLERISQPFYRADNATRIQGSGLGLSIALRVLEKSGIQYKITSKENKGTCIELLFRSQK